MRSRLKKAIFVNTTFIILLIYELIVKAVCIGQGFCDAYDNGVIIALISAIGGVTGFYQAAETIRPSEIEE